MADSKTKVKKKVIKKAMPKVKTITKPIVKKTIPVKPIKKKVIVKKDYNKLFNRVIIEVSENGKSVIAALKGKMSTQKFYELIEDEEKAKRYARACEDRADNIADEILSIADAGSNSDNIIVQRDRLRVDSRKWILAKLHPKKYGDKIDMTSNGKDLIPARTLTKKEASQLFKDLNEGKFPDV